MLSNVLQRRNGTERRGVAMSLLDIPDVQDQFTSESNHLFHENSEEVLILKRDITDGAIFQELLSRRPNGVIPALRDLGVTKLGNLDVKDTDARAAFNKNLILTRGHDRPDDENYVDTWQSLIAVKAMRRMTRDEGGWHEPVRLAVYRVNFKNAASILNQGVLKPLLRKERRGTTGDEVWEFPAIQAIVEHKWQHWAFRMLWMSFSIYLLWLLSFVIFMLIYIELEGHSRHMSEMNGREKVGVVCERVCNICALVFTTPFVLLEINFMIHYRWRWIQLWNILESFTYILQIIISIGCLTDCFFNNKYYNALLAIHSVLLFQRLQYYARVVGMGASYIEALSELIYKIRFFLFFVVTSMISVAISLAVLYKVDVESKHKQDREMELGNPADNSTAILNDTTIYDGSMSNRGGKQSDRTLRHTNCSERSHKDEIRQHSLEDFGSLPRSLGTSFALLLGSFDTSYVYLTSNRVTKQLFFIIFQLLLAITILNIMIAVMTEAYTEIMESKRMMFYRSRAQLIDKMEVTLPSKWLPNWKPYVHFVVVERQQTPIYHIDGLEQRSSTLTAQSTDNDAEIGELKGMIQELNASVHAMREEIKQLSKT